MTAERYAAIIDGPKWWGDATAAPDGSSLLLGSGNAAARHDRWSTAHDETAAIEAAVKALPPGTLVLHSATRGAAVEAVAAAGRAGLPTMAFPVRDWTSRPLEYPAAMADVLAGLQLRGWKVKACIAWPPGDTYLGYKPEVTYVSLLVEALREAGIKVRLLTPALPEAPEPTPDGP